MAPWIVWGAASSVARCVFPAIFLAVIRPRPRVLMCAAASPPQTFDRPPDPHFSPSDPFNALNTRVPPPFSPPRRPRSHSWHTHTPLGLLRALLPAGARALVPPPRLLQRVLADCTLVDHDRRIALGDCTPLV